MNRRLSTLSLAILHGLSGTAAASSLGLEDVPAGFESLVEGQVEQLDVWWLGRSLGLHPVLVRPDSVELRDPARLATLLRDAGVSATQEELLALLTREMPGNGHLACGSSTTTETSCGYLETDDVALSAR
jgi:Mat/Ecp fimbriae outer membrane usher protein